MGDGGVWMVVGEEGGGGVWRGEERVEGMGLGEA